jgi:polar amino acid transport system permease protein
MAVDETTSRPAEHGADIGAVAATYRRVAGPLWVGIWAGLAGLFLWRVLDVEWDVVGDFLFDDRIIKGFLVTLHLTFWSMLFGVILGLIFGVMRVVKSPPANGLATLYVWLIRGTPVILQLFLFYFALREYVAPEALGLGNRDEPFAGIPLLSAFNDVGFRAAVVALAINEGAYMAEIVRAGIISVDPGQMDAARSLGMTNLQGMRRIVVPQAVRVIVPPTGNELIALVKNTSLVFTISVFELFAESRRIYGRNFDIFELLIVAAFWYLIATTVFSVLQAYLEARLRTDGASARGVPLWKRVAEIATRPRQAPAGHE